MLIARIRRQVGALLRRRLASGASRSIDLAAGTSELFPRFRYEDRLCSSVRLRGARGVVPGAGPVRDGSDRGVGSCGMPAHPHTHH